MSRIQSAIPKGEEHGYWTALGQQKKRVYKNKPHTVSLFQCRCGVQRWFKDAEVRSERSYSCRDCVKRRVLDLTDEDRARKEYVDRLWPNYQGEK